MKSHKIALGRRVLGFTVLPFVSSLSPFLLLPLLARRVSSAEWAGLGVGQSVGMVGAVAVTWGWQLLGPVRIARAGKEERQARYLDSMVTRGLVCLVLTPILALLAGFLTPHEGRLLSVTMAAAICLSGLTPAWYFVGLGKPIGIFTWDVLPRLIATVVAAVVVVAGGPAVSYPVGLGVAGLVAVVVLSFRELHGYRVAAHLQDTDHLRAELRRGFTPMSTELTLSLYSSGSVAFVSWRGSTQTVAEYSSAYRLFRLAMYLVTAMANGLQGWVAEREGQARGRRMVGALTAHAIIGVIGMLGMVALMPEVSTLLFGANLSVDRVASLYLGLTFFAASIGTSLARHVLIPEGATNGVFYSTFIGAAVGIPLLVVFSQRWGVPGASAALLLSQLVTISTILRRSYRVLHRLRTAPEPVEAGQVG
jgi:O-antigen/teichoic acid export membrane protein